MARSKRRKSPRRRRRSVRRTAVRYALNPRRRRRRNKRRAVSHRRHYRSNPPAMRGVFNDALWAGAGYMGTKFAVGMVLPAINISASPPSMMSIAAKFGTAYLVAWGGEKILGSSKFTPMFLGGVVSAIQDIVTLYIAPSIPALAGDGDYLGAYYRPPLLSARPISRVPGLPAPSMGSYAGELSAEDMI